MGYMIPTEAFIIERYQESTLESLMLLRVNLWKDLVFEDLTPTVRAMLADIEDRIQQSRKVLLQSAVIDPDLTRERFAKITSNIVSADATGKLKQ